MTYVKDAWVRRLLLGAAAGGLSLAMMPGLAFAAPKGSKAGDDASSSSSDKPSAKKHSKHTPHGAHAQKSKGHAAKKGEGDKAHGKHGKARENDRDKDDADRDRDEKGDKGSSKLPALSKPARADHKAEKSEHKPEHKAEKHASGRHGKTAHVSHGKESRHEAPSAEKKNDCVRDAVEIGRGSGESERFSLTRCSGKPADKALEQLSVLIRPYSAQKPEKLPDVASKKGGHDGELAPGVKLADAGLLSRLQAIASQYSGKKLVVVSGYRPGSTGSYHKHAKAIDLRVEGVKNDELATFCRSLVDTGCGYYPNSSFVHIDVRPKGSGHVYWIDAAGPGEAPRYVRSWPPKDGKDAEEIDRPDHAAPSDEHTHPDAKKKAGKGAGELDRDVEDDPGERSPTGD